MNVRVLLRHFGVALLVVWLVHIVIVTVLMLVGVVRQSWMESLLQTAANP